MATFQMPVGIPTNDIAEFIEAVRCVAALEGVVIIEAKNKREAVKVLAETLEEYNATYRGTHDFNLTEDIQQNLRRTKAPFSGAGGYGLSPREYDL